MAATIRSRPRALRRWLGYPGVQALLPHWRSIPLCWLTHVDCYFLVSQRGGMLQFVSALEARLRWCDRKSVIYLNPNLDPLVPLAGQYWDEVRRWTFPTEGGGGRFGQMQRAAEITISLRGLARHISKDGATRLLVGQDVRLPRIMWRFIEPRPEYWILDDGLGGVELSAERQTRLALGQTGFRSWRLNLFDNALGRNYSPIAPATFFTAFPMALAPGDRVIPHRFEAVHALFENQARAHGREALIVGTRMETIEADRTKWVSIVQREVEVVKTAGEDRVVFSPHPADSAFSWGPSELGCDEVWRPDLPLELALLQRAELPARIHFFASSSLTVLRMLLPASVNITTTQH